MPEITGLILQNFRKSRFIQQFSKWIPLKTSHVIAKRVCLLIFEGEGNYNGYTFSKKYS
jgi:hypothetical protein